MSLDENFHGEGIVIAHAVTAVVHDPEPGGGETVGAGKKRERNLLSLGAVRRIRWKPSRSYVAGLTSFSSTPSLKRFLPLTVVNQMKGRRRAKASRFLMLSLRRGRKGTFLSRTLKSMAKTSSCGSQHAARTFSKSPTLPIL